MAYEQRSLDDYVDVAERIGEFRDRYPSGTLRGDFQMLEVGGRLTGRDIAEPADMSYNEAIMVKARVDSWDGRTEELLSPFAAERSGSGAS